MTDLGGNRNDPLAVCRKLCLLLALTAVTLAGLSIVLYTQGSIVLGVMVCLSMVLGLAIFASVRVWYMLRQADQNNSTPRADAGAGAEH